MTSTPVAGTSLPIARPPSFAGSRARPLLAVLAVLAMSVALAGPARVADMLSGFLRAYVDAQGAMLRAAGNVTADGRSEFAVLLRDGASAAALRQALASIADVDFGREADLPGWVVVSTPAGNRAGLEALRALPQARLVIPNRGLWFCH